MAETRAQQGSFDWVPEQCATAEPERVHASPPQTAAVDAKPRRTPRVRPELADPDQRWLTADEATLHLGLPTRKALYAAVERGQVPTHRFGRRLRFNRRELDALLGRPR